MAGKKNNESKTTSTSSSKEEPAPATAASSAAETPSTAPGVAPATGEKPPITAYEAVLARALEHKGTLKKCTANVDLVRANVRTSVASLQPLSARFEKELPGIPFSHVLDSLELASALVHAQQLAESTEPPPRTRPANLETKLARLYELRGQMLAVGEVLAQRGDLPVKRLQGIRAGTGKLDAANDGSSLNGVYTDFARTIANKHPFTVEEITEIGQIGHELSQYYQPGAAKKPAPLPAEETTPPDEIRDRIWTVLNEVYGEVRKAGYYFFGEEAATRVPPLQARLAAPHAPAETPPKPKPSP